eukprot:TRINITY_DN81563_c0_g1_i1.p1 TRINITY_DN81563_c0_g1~~TRINITY_DN81563_c0_g1_i1.p1  ORF type:complete len:931 (+),score=198.55 TRINITY_DN81563_c0_g1_i1:218-3010(+)
MRRAGGVAASTRTWRSWQMRLPWLAVGASTLYAADASSNLRGEAVVAEAVEKDNGLGSEHPEAQDAESSRSAPLHALDAADVPANMSLDDLFGRSLQWELMDRTTTRDPWSGHGWSLDKEVVGNLRAAFGTDMVVQMDDCAIELNPAVCSLDPFAEELSQAAYKLRDMFNVCPRCQYREAYCEEYWQAVGPSVYNLETVCRQRGRFPPQCEKMVAMLTSMASGRTFDLSVMCRLIAPHLAPADDPPVQCVDLVEATGRVTPTLASRSAFKWDSQVYKAVAREEAAALAEIQAEQEENIKLKKEDENAEPRGIEPMPEVEKCVHHLCDVLATFRWRIRPRNMQDDEAERLYANDFVVPGCEDVERYPFSIETCPLRRDIRGFCDCIGTKVETLDTPPLSGVLCPENVDQYLFFGRIGVEDVPLDVSCNPGLCGIFNDLRMTTDECRSLEMPGMEECTAMQLWALQQADVETCPWLSDSGEDGILICQDGTRCAVEEKYLADADPPIAPDVPVGWSCCEGARRGRGQCPRDTPVMCNTICSGKTEYCCAEPGQCTPRTCTPLLQAEPLFWPQINGTTTTTPPPGGFEGEVPSLWKRLFGYDVAFTVDPLMFVYWLIVVVPLGLAILTYWQWKRVSIAMEMMEPVDMEPDSKVTVEAENAADGRYHFVRRPQVQEEAVRRRNLARVVVPELPEKRPLGLELQELQVIRVHRFGEKCGWKVGDMILQIAEFKVKNFEELWERIQIERDRAPITFIVERLGENMVDEDAVKIVEENAVVKSEPRKARSRAGTAAESFWGSQTGSPTGATGEQLGGFGTLRETASADDYDESEYSEEGHSSAYSSALPGYNDEWETDDAASSIADQRQVQPEWLTRLQQRPRIDAAFAKVGKDSEKKNFFKKPTGEDTTVKFVRDSWGREVLMSTMPRKSGPKTLK